LADVRPFSRNQGCRCQHSNVSGLAIVAISRKAARPTRYARAASSRRSSSVRRSRRLPSCRRRSRFSSRRQVISSRSRRSNPADHHAQHRLERHGGDHEAELISPVGLKAVGRVVEHYGSSSPYGGQGRLRAGRVDSVRGPLSFVRGP
jgi:hypothetical protein